MMLAVAGLLCGCARLAVNQTGLSYYVSLAGDDANSGGRGAPFATLERAREAVRRLNQTGVLPLGGVTVYVRGGRYALTHGVVLDGRDSGQEDRPVVYRAFPGEEVLLTGAAQVPSQPPVLCEPIVTLAGAQYVVWQGFTMECVRGVAAQVTGGCHNVIAACTIRNTGEAGVVVDGSDNGVVGCDIDNTGASGVCIQGGDRLTLKAAGNYADNNHVHHVACQRQSSAAAIRLTGVGNRVTHNLIHDAPYAGVLYEGNDHRIELNEIVWTCLEARDSGALYSGRDWGSQGNVVHGNFIHHIGGTAGAAAGVCLDDCDSGDTIEQNVFCQVDPGVAIGGGRDHTVLNNVFVDCGVALRVDDRGRSRLRLGAGASEPWDLGAALDALKYRQPPWSERYPQLARILEDRPELPLHNVLSRNLCVRGTWLQAPDEAAGYLEGQDNLTTDEDPGFVDPRRLDLRLREDSRVWQDVPGFVNVPMRRAGPYRDALRASWPVRRPLCGGLARQASKPSP